MTFLVRELEPFWERESWVHCYATLGHTQVTRINVWWLCRLMAPKLSHRTETLLSTRLQRCVWKLPGAAEIVDAACFLSFWFYGNPRVIVMSPSGLSSIPLISITDIREYHSGKILDDHWSSGHSTCGDAGTKFSRGCLSGCFRGWTAARAGYCWGKAVEESDGARPSCGGGLKDKGLALKRSF